MESFCGPGGTEEQKFGGMFARCNFDEMSMQRQLYEGDETSKVFLSHGQITEITILTMITTSVCLCLVQVQAALKRQWMQYKTQWGQRRKDHCSMRSTSYTATSITEVPAFMYHHDCNSEHLNGRHTEDSELVALKSGETYA